jgi:hypothetical protein
VRGFIDALALAYSAPPLKPKVSGGAAKWKRFVERYFPADYASLADEYDGFRNRLLHNFSACHTFGFTHDEPHRHLRTDGGRVMFNRAEFVADVIRAFDGFERDVLAEDALAERVLAGLDQRPPVGLFVPSRVLRLTPGELIELARAGTAPTLSTQALTGTGPAISLRPVPSASIAPPRDQSGQIEGMERSPDRSRSQPTRARSIKSTKPKKPER